MRAVIKYLRFKSDLSRVGISYRAIRHTCKKCNERFLNTMCSRTAVPMQKGEILNASARVQISNVTVAEVVTTTVLKVAFQPDVRSFIDILRARCRNNKCSRDRFLTMVFYAPRRSGDLSSRVSFRKLFRHAFTVRRFPYLALSFSHRYRYTTTNGRLYFSL